MQAGEKMRKSIFIILTLIIIVGCSSITIKTKPKGAKIYKKMSEVGKECEKNTEKYKIIGEEPIKLSLIHI